MKAKYLDKFFVFALLIIFNSTLIGCASLLPDGCRRGNCKNGFGYGVYDSGISSYEGEHLNGEWHGKGTFNYRGIWKYEGDWVNSKRHGQGTLSWLSGKSAGRKYVGGFKNGKMHGIGTFYLPNGNKYVGEFKNGYYDGKGTFYYADGSKFYEGEWKKDNFHGFGVKTESNGKVISGMWKNDKLITECDKSFDTYLNEAYDFYRDSDYGAAINNLNRITKDYDPFIFYVAQNDIGVALLKKGNLNESEEFFNRLINDLENTSENEIKSKSRDFLLFYAYYNLALIKFKNNDKASAERYLFMAKESNPGKFKKKKSMSPIFLRRKSK